MCKLLSYNSTLHIVDNYLPFIIYRTTKKHVHIMRSRYMRLQWRKACMHYGYWSSCVCKSRVDVFVLFVSVLFCMIICVPYINIVSAIIFTAQNYVDVDCTVKWRIGFSVRVPDRLWCQHYVFYFFLTLLLPIFWEICSVSATFIQNIKLHIISNFFKPLKVLTDFDEIFK